MAPPAYLEITQDMIPEVATEDGTVKVLSGSYQGAQGITPDHSKITIYDITICKRKEMRIETKEDETVFLFSILGNTLIETEIIPEKTAALLSSGKDVCLSSPQDCDSRCLLFSGEALKEPIAWGGPIVMNAEEELRQAFDELRNGNFIK